jgi:polyisoprenoid-binding protein YceI
MFKYRSKVKNTALIILFAIIITSCGKNEGPSTTTKNEKLNAKGTAFIVDTKSSLINWLAKKVTGQHTGTVNILNGELLIDNGKLTGGKFEIDFKSIKVLDLKDEEMNKKLTGHLKSDDFFAVEKFPVGKLEITGIKETSTTPGNNYSIKANLTIKGITKEISFPAKIDIDNNNAIAEATAEIDRTDWDIKFRSDKFFENLGDNLIYDKISLEIKLKANS